MNARAAPAPAARRGFTLLEVTVSVAILALMLTFLYQILAKTIQNRDAMREELEGPKVETAILDELTRDLRFIYYRPGQLPGDAGFWGRDRTPNGLDGDRIDFLTCRPSRVAALEEASGAQANAPLIEVGWACRPSERYDRMLELWRREDYFVDDDPTDGGQFYLVYDKIRRFDLRYYAPTEERAEGDNGLAEWRSTEAKKLPYAIVVSLQYDVTPPAENERGRAQLPPQGFVRRILLLTAARSLPPDAGMGATAMGM